jgi:hypothetical protein
MLNDKIRNFFFKKSNEKKSQVWKPRWQYESWILNNRHLRKMFLSSEAAYMWPNSGGDFSQTRPPIEYGHHCSGPKIKVEVGDLA